jgi:hypothetical protein
MYHVEVIMKHLKQKTISYIYYWNCFIVHLNPDKGHPISGTPYIYIICRSTETCTQLALVHAKK